MGSGIIYDVSEYGWAFERKQTEQEEIIAGNNEKNILLIAGWLPFVSDYYIQGNQNRKERDFWACTIYSNAGVIWDHNGWTQDQYYAFIDRVVNRQEANGEFKVVGGAFTSNSADGVAEQYNEENPGKKVRKVVIKIGSSLFWTLATRWYSFAMTYMSSAAYVADAKDGKLDGISWTGAQGGHSIRWKNLKNLRKWQLPAIMTALDNYYANKNKPEEGFRKYEIARTSIPHIKWNGTYFENCYTFIEEKYFA